MTLLSKTAILCANDLQTEDVDVPEWGGVVRVRSFTGRERDAFEASMVRGEGKDRKRVDLLVANDVSEPGSGFSVETNRVTLIAPGTELTPGAEPEAWPLLSKREVADRLLDRLVALEGDPDRRRADRLDLVSGNRATSPGR